MQYLSLWLFIEINLTDYFGSSFRRRRRRRHHRRSGSWDRQRPAGVATPR